MGGWGVLGQEVEGGNTGRDSKDEGHLYGNLRQ